MKKKKNPTASEDAERPAPSPAPLVGGSFHRGALETALQDLRRENTATPSAPEPSPHPTETQIRAQKTRTACSCPALPGHPSTAHPSPADWAHRGTFPHGTACSKRPAVAPGHSTGASEPPTQGARQAHERRHRCRVQSQSAALGQWPPSVSVVTAGGTGRGGSGGPAMLFLELADEKYV